MGKRIRYFVSGFGLLALLSTPATAHAAPLVVTDGLVQGFANLFGAIQQYEGKNFTLQYAGPFAARVAGDCSPCEPGTDVTLDGMLFGEMGGGQFTLDGVNYDSNVFTVTGTFTTSHFVLPPILSADPLTVALPFTFSGEVRSMK
jgi:hypothetical protein